MMADESSEETLEEQVMFNSSAVLVLTLDLRISLE
jgi:hypothetical protein